MNTPSSRAATPPLSTLETAPMDPALAGFLAQAAAQGTPPVETLPPPVRRQIYREMAAALGLPAPVVGDVSDISIPGPGGALTLRVYQPTTNAKGGPRPVLLFMHGGGFVMGDLETHDKVCRTLCAQAGRLVLALDYRLAPEHIFPAAVEDAEAALRWVLSNVTTLGGDAANVALAGDSGGAQLAFAAVRRVNSPHVRALGLMYPAAQHFEDPSPSFLENGDGKFLTRGMIRTFLGSYLGGKADAVTHPDYALLKSGGFERMPPTWVGTMGHDPLRDEGHALALKLGGAGVALTHKHYPSAIHACIHFTAVSQVGQQVMNDLAQWLQNH